MSLCHHFLIISFISLITKRKNDVISQKVSYQPIIKLVFPVSKPAGSFEISFPFFFRRLGNNVKSELSFTPHKLFHAHLGIINIQRACLLLKSQAANHDNHISLKQLFNDTFIQEMRLAQFVHIRCYV